MLRELEKVVHPRFSDHANFIKSDNSKMSPNVPMALVFSRKLFDEEFLGVFFYVCKPTCTLLIDVCGDTGSLRLSLKYSPTRLEYENGNA